MKLSVGMDSVEIVRVAKCLRREAFLRRVYTPQEQAQLAQKGNAPQTAAGYFAAKEAFAKALGTGVRGFSFQEIWVEYDKLGQPRLRVKGKARRLLGWRRKTALTITHTRTDASAVVVLYQE